MSILYRIGTNNQWFIYFIVVVGGISAYEGDGIKKMSSGGEMLKKRNKQGVTVVEALLAVSLLAVAAAGSVKLVVATRQLADSVTDKHKATQVIRNQIERIDMSSFDDLDMWTVNEQMIDETGAPNSEGRFRLTTEVTHPYTNLTQVVIRVDTQNRKTLDFNLTGKEITMFISDI